MKILQITWWLYSTALLRSLECVRKNWVVSFAPLAYGIILSGAGMILWRLGIIGGILMGLIMQACVSSGLHLLGNMVNSGKAGLDDFVKGFTVYLWELLGIAFILWIPLRIAATVLSVVEVSTPTEFVKSRNEVVKSFLEAQYITKQGVWEKAVRK